MNTHERQILIREAVVKIEAIDKDLPPVERIMRANEIISDLDQQLFPEG